jgi:hypothetical protein
MNTIERRNFISCDSSVARNSYGEYFSVGEEVSHDDETVGSAYITGFEIDDAYNEVKVLTSKGYAHLDFLRKI